MNLRSLFILAVLALLGVFTALNWASVTAPANLHFGFARIEAPLGVVMLLFAGVLVVVFMLIVARVEITALLEARRATKELDEARRVADKAEASRLRELRDLVASEMGLLRADVAQLRGELARLGQSQTGRGESSRPAA